MSTLRTLAGRTAAAGAVALVLPLLAAGPALAGGVGEQKRSEKAAAASARDDVRDPADPSGSSDNPDGTFQGKGSSTPDQDGKGMDRGLDNDDKTGPGTDGNNGCGNEPREAAPRDGGRPTEDDNNGWCGSRPKPAKPETPASSNGQGPDRDEQETPGAEPVEQPVDGVVDGDGVVSTPTTPTSGPVEGSLDGGSPADDGAVAPAGSPTPAVLAGVTTRSVTSASPLPGLAVGTGSAGVGAGTATADVPLTLPFTGGPLALLALLGSGALASGGGLLLAARRRG